MPAIEKLLIANRGEIACRIIASAKNRGCRTVAVYSDADAEALHVRMADEAVRIGPPPAVESYLSAERIIEAALRSGAQAVHPGYGFLSERAPFAEACVAAGLIFVGPDPEAIRIMGDKAQSKRRMIEAGVPCVPGYQGDDQSEGTFRREAEAIGYPVMVKASAGGGGRGMRLVENAGALSAALRSARSEAQAAFGDGRLLLERAVIEPRHVEIQVLGDRHGSVIHLGERDCSVQRRHQKVLEEAPSPAVDPALRARMGEAAVRAARSVSYVGAGTVEFLLAPDGEFYFLEMNTRLQVEHPVTELVTGLDLVALQLDVAEGKPLPLVQDDVRLSGHAIEARLYAEDPAAGFLPQIGLVDVWAPARGEGVRIDHGVRTGAAVSPFYDPMLAKIIAWGADREQARLRLLRAIEDTRLFGVTTNRAFLAAALRNAEFAAGEATTAFIGRHFGDGFTDPSPPDWVAPLAAALLSEATGEGWRTNAWANHPLTLEGPGGEESWEAWREGDRWNLRQGERLTNLALLDRDGVELLVEVDGRILRAACHRTSGAAPGVQIDVRGVLYGFRDLTFRRPQSADAGDASGVVAAPMNGSIVSIEVAQGDTVVRGQLLAVLEAMKMQHQIVAPVDGVVEMVAAQAGAQVAPRDTLLVIRTEVEA